MTTATLSLAEYVKRDAAAIAGACTACGRCVEVCPVVPHIDVAGETPAAITASVRDWLRGAAAPSPASARWADACNGCGDCIPRCPEAINPRRMLVLANTMRAGEVRATPELFRKMSRAIRLVAGMQLLPEEYLRLLRQPFARPVPVVFHVACNPTRTPHLLFNAMRVLDAIGVDYEVLGGPGVCCGIIHAKWEGEAATADRVTSGTLARFEMFRPQKVLTWCPSCQVHLGESLAGFRPASFDLEHVTELFVAHAEALRAKFRRPVPRRVVLHAHVGLPEVGRNVASLLGAVPGLTILDTVWESGYACGGSGCNRAPALQAIEHGRLLDRVRETGADTLVTLYHGCHMAFMTSEKGAAFRVSNFTDLLVEALGRTPHDDVMKRYRLHDDVKMIVEEGMPLLRANGIDIDPAMLERILPELLTLAEFRGGLDCFASAPRDAAPRAT